MTDPSTWTTDLGRAMRDVLARLELVSAGTTASWGAAGSGGEQTRGPVSGDANPPHLYFREDYERAHHDDLEHEARDGGPTHRSRRRVLTAARDELERLTGRGAAARERPAGESAADLAQRIVDEGAGYTVAEAAVRFRCGPRNVVKAREAGNRAVDTGDPLEPTSSKDRAAAFRRAERMAAEGMTVRQIEFTTGLPKSTVADHLKRLSA